MRRMVSIVAALLIIAALTLQMAAAASRSERKAPRSSAHVTRPVRDAFGSAPKATNTTTSTTTGNKLCDIVWCYDN
jgi:hypothetical protein